MPSRTLMVLLTVSYCNIPPAIAVEVGNSDAGGTATYGDTRVGGKGFAQAATADSKKISNCRGVMNVKSFERERVSSSQWKEYRKKETAASTLPFILF